MKALSGASLPNVRRGPTAETAATGAIPTLVGGERQTLDYRHTNSKRTAIE
jgi:hypothetical protein